MIDREKKSYLESLRNNFITFPKRRQWSLLWCFVVWR